MSLADLWDQQKQQQKCKLAMNNPQNKFIKTIPLISSINNNKLLGINLTAV